MTYKIKAALSAHAQMVFKFSAYLGKERNKYQVPVLASLKTITNSQDCSGSHIKFLFRRFFSIISQFFPVYIQGRLSERKSMDDILLLLGNKKSFNCQPRISGGFFWEQLLESQAAIRKPEPAF
jgi:hypothetical protein